MSADLKDDPVQLIQQVAGGDREAFGRLYDRYASLVFTFAVRLLNRPSEAEDLLQEVFLQVWRQARTYRQDRGSPEAWITMITRSRAIDKLRSIRRIEKSLTSLENAPGVKSGGTVETVSEESELNLTVRGALAELPEVQRRVLELAYFEGLTQSDIAARLGEPLGTVKTRMRAGLERLRGFLGAKAKGELS
ncbi:MAG: sigma-70 family RNA polymerase sigma factor [Candidatus Tectomicrobia bacterium]|uniref:RNA polymerase sigma factor n=1 Tax=Tectimicrobiota bacterium TaxID=2528274 RepID=A0A932GPS5_UNCTE|nr:sigma-70 family RNA polymerase sigma factor [Candidatus Tectomicrobia bacterium]